jgi:MFS family permease
MNRLRSLFPPLGRRAWRLLAGQALSQIGTGLTFPILLLYLHNARGLDLSTAGLVLAATSMAGLATLPAIGYLVDRIGAGRGLVAALGFCAAGTAGFALVHGVAGAFAAAAVYGIGVTGMWNALSTLFARVVPAHLRGGVFGVNYALQNLGFGLGATLGGLALDPRSPRSFQLLFLADAGSFVLFALVMLAAGEVRTAAEERAAAREAGEAESGEEADEARPKASGATGYRLVFQDRALLACAGLNTLLSAVSFSQLNSAFPAWVTGPVGLSPRIVGLAFLANTLVIVFVQLLVLRYLLPGRHRTRAVAAAALLFGTAWLIILAARSLPTPALAAAALVGGLSVFGLGETLLAPSLPALVNDLAEESLRGRYNAVYSLSWQIGPIIGPIAAGFMLSRGWGVTHLLGLALACGLAAGLAVRIERVVPAAANLVRHSTQPSSEQT